MYFIITFFDLVLYLLVNTQYSRGNFDKLKGDIRLMKEELIGIERYRTTKERLLSQALSNLEAMQTTHSGLESELHQVYIQ